jgi:predicted glycoside hydrolase/deacetylase ChbG (UPF0249 family)
MPGTMQVHVHLIVTADDLGIGKDRDDGILAAFQQGIVTNASLLVNGCSARQAGSRSFCSSANMFS